VPLVTLWSEYVLPRVEGATRDGPLQPYDYDDEKWAAGLRWDAHLGHLLR
jgi:hypothetical protein